MIYQDLSKFRLPAGFRGRSKVIVQLWWVIQATIFRASPQFFYPLRRALLRLFGAKIGIGVLIRPTVRVTYPWKVSVGDHSWIGDDVVLYSLGEIQIGENCVISQGSYLCAADHDYTCADFPIRGRKITIEQQSWIAADVFVAPGVVIGLGAVVGARSTVLRDVPAGMLCAGSPCLPIKKRDSLHKLECGEYRCG